MKTRVLLLSSILATSVFASGFDINYIGGTTKVKDKSASTNGIELIQDMSKDKTGMFVNFKARLKGGDNAAANLETNIGYQIGDVKENGLVQLSVAGLGYDYYTSKKYSDDPKFHLLTYRAGVGYKKENILTEGLGAYAGAYYLKALASAFESTTGDTSEFAKPTGMEAEAGISYRFSKSMAANIGYFYKKYSFDATNSNGISVSKMDIKESQIRAGLGFRF